jgi:hypothetical protein
VEGAFWRKELLPENQIWEGYPDSPEDVELLTYQLIMHFIAVGGAEGDYLLAASLPIYATELGWNEFYQDWSFQFSSFNSMWLYFYNSITNAWVWHANVGQVETIYIQGQNFSMLQANHDILYKYGGLIYFAKTTPDIFYENRRINL